MKIKRIVSVFSLLFLCVALWASNTYWENVKQNPHVVYDITSMRIFPGVMLEDNGLKQELIFDYNSQELSFMGSMQGDYGRLGIFIDRGENTVLKNQINVFTGRTVNPVILGAFAAKNIGPVNLGFAVRGFSLNDYYNDELSIYDNINAEFTQFTFGPSVSVVLPGELIAEIAPHFTLRSAVYEDYITLIGSNASFGYDINGRLIQHMSGNLFEIFAHYSSQAYPYSITESNQTENYYQRKDSIGIGFLAHFKTFNYITSYMGIQYASTSLFDSITYYNGSDSKSMITNTVLPELDMGIDVYINRLINVQFGVSGAWVTERDEQSPNLNPVLAESDFEIDYVMGLQFNYNSFRIDIGLNKNIFKLPYIVTGKEFDDASFRLGICYNGFEY